MLCGKRVTPRLVAQIGPERDRETKGPREGARGGPLVPMMTPGNGSLQHWQRCPTAHRLAAVEKRFETVEDLIRQVETTAAEEPDVLALVVAIIKFFVRSEIDPYLLSGVLIEGIAGTINGRIPEDRKREVAVQAIRLLQERLQAGGAI
jgi:hypothetical protein